MSLVGCSGWRRRPAPPVGCKLLRGPLVGSDGGCGERSAPARGQLPPGHPSTTASLENAAESYSNITMIDWIELNICWNTMETKDIMTSLSLCYQMDTKYLHIVSASAYVWSLYCSEGNTEAKMLWYHLELINTSNLTAICQSLSLYIVCLVIGVNRA